MEEKNIELTDEIRERLKKNGMLGFDVETEFKYVPIFYRDVKNKIPKKCWPVFILRSRGGIALAEAEDGLGYLNIDEKEGRKFVIDSGKARITALEEGLISFKNFPVENGKSVSMAKGEAVTKYINLFHPRLQTELQKAIDNHSTLNEDELLGLE
jgi:hypothetical protein